MSTRPLYPAEAKGYQPPAASPLLKALERASNDEDGSNKVDAQETPPQESSSFLGKRPA